MKIIIGIVKIHEKEINNIADVYPGKSSYLLAFLILLFKHFIIVLLDSLGINFKNSNIQIKTSNDIIKYIINNFYIYQLKQIFAPYTQHHNMLKIHVLNFQ